MDTLGSVEPVTTLGFNPASPESRREVSMGFYPASPELSSGFEFQPAGSPSAVADPAAFAEIRAQFEAARPKAPDASQFEFEAVDYGQYQELDFGSGEHQF